jgi:hypothetical protein
MGLGIGRLYAQLGCAAYFTIATAFKICASHRKTGLSGLLPGISFPNLIRFLHRQVISPQQPPPPPKHVQVKTALEDHF